MIAHSELQKITPANVSCQVMRLARDHKIKDEKTNIDFVANKFAELSGNDVYEDEIMRLCVMLARKKLITKAEALRLVHLHLRGIR